LCLIRHNIRNEEQLQKSGEISCVFPVICIVELHIILNYGPPLRNSREQAGRTICAQQLAEQIVSKSIASVNNQFTLQLFDLAVLIVWGRLYIQSTVCARIWLCSRFQPLGYYNVIQSRVNSACDTVVTFLTN
jgi:hypothetical protein